MTVHQTIQKLKQNPLLILFLLAGVIVLIGFLIFSLFVSVAGLLCMLIICIIGIEGNKKPLIFAENEDSNKQNPEFTGSCVINYGGTKKVLTRGYSGTMKEAQKNASDFLCSLPPDQLVEITENSRPIGHNSTEWHVTVWYREF